MTQQARCIVAASGEGALRDLESAPSRAPHSASWPSESGAEGESKRVERAGTEVRVDAGRGALRVEQVARLLKFQPQLGVLRGALGELARSRRKP